MICPPMLAGGPFGSKGRPIMDAVLSLLISAGIFGIWIVASTITAGWGWTLLGLGLDDPF